MDDSGLWIEVTVPAHGFTFDVVHAPTSPRSKIKDILSRLETSLEVLALRQ
jgi:hypothetical protein